MEPCDKMQEQETGDMQFKQHGSGANTKNKRLVVLEDDHNNLFKFSIKRHYKAYYSH